MNRDSISRREFLGKTAAAGTMTLSGCGSSSSEYEDSSDKSGENTPKTTLEYNILEKGGTNDNLGLTLEKLDKENGTAQFGLFGGSSQQYREGDRIICDKTEEENIGAYLEEIDYKMEEVSLRLEDSC